MWQFIQAQVRAGVVENSDVIDTSSNAEPTERTRKPDNFLGSLMTR